MASTGKKRSASVGAPPSFASSMQEKLQQNASLVQLEKPKKNTLSHNKNTLQNKSFNSPHSRSHPSEKQLPTDTTSSSLQKELQQQLENDLPPQLLLQMQMQTLLRPYLQLRPSTPPDYVSSPAPLHSDSSSSSAATDGDGKDELNEAEQDSDETRDSEESLNSNTKESDISDVLQSYSQAFVDNSKGVPSLLSRTTPKKAHKDTELTFHPRIDGKSQKMTASRHLLDNRNRAHILHDLDKEITQHKDSMRRTHAEHNMKPYTFAPQLIDPSPKSDREVVDRLHNWHKERDDKIERLRLDNQVLQITNDMGECSFSPTVLPGYRPGYPTAPSPGVDKFIERHARARQEKEERESPYLPGENWTPKLTQPKEFNFMVRERVKELLHDPTSASPSPASRSRSLPVSPISFRGRQVRHSREYASNIPQYHPQSNSPPSSPHSFRSSISDLDAPLRETDTRSSADFEQLRYYLSDYAVQNPIHTPMIHPHSASSSFIHDASTDSHSDYTQSTTYNDDSNSDNTSIVYYNDNDKQYPPSTPNTRSRSNSHNLPPQNIAIPVRTVHPLSISSPANHILEEETSNDNSSTITTQSIEQEQIRQSNENFKPVPRFQKLSHLNSYGRPNSAPPSLHNAEMGLKHSNSLTRKHIAPTSQQKHQQLLLRIQQQQVQQQHQQQQQQQLQLQQLQFQQNTGYDPFFNNSMNQEYHYPLQPQLQPPSTPSYQ